MKKILAIVCLLSISFTAKGEPATEFKEVITIPVAASFCISPIDKQQYMQHRLADDSVTVEQVSKELAEFDRKCKEASATESEK